MADWAFLFNDGGEMEPSFSIAGRLPFARGDAFPPAGAIDELDKGFADSARGREREWRGWAGGRCGCDEVVERLATVLGTRWRAGLTGQGGQVPGATSRDLAGLVAFPTGGSLINRPTDNLQRAKPTDISGTLPSHLNFTSTDLWCAPRVNLTGGARDSAAKALISTAPRR